MAMAEHPGPYQILQHLPEHCWDEVQPALGFQLSISVWAVWPGMGGSSLATWSSSL